MFSRGIPGGLMLVIVLTAFAVIGVPRTGAAPVPAAPTLVAPAPQPTTSAPDMGWQPPTPLVAKPPTDAWVGGVALSGDGTGMILWRKGGVRQTVWATHFIPNGGGDAGTTWQVPTQVSNSQYDAYLTAPSAIAMDATGDAMAV